MVEEFLMAKETPRSCSKGIVYHVQEEFELTYLCQDKSNLVRSMPHHHPQGHQKLPPALAQHRQEPSLPSLLVPQTDEGRSWQQGSGYA